MILWLVHFTFNLNTGFKETCISGFYQPYTGIDKKKVMCEVLMLLNISWIPSSKEYGSCGCDVSRSLVYFDASKQFQPWNILIAIYDQEENQVFTLLLSSEQESNILAPSKVWQLNHLAGGYNIANGNSWEQSINTCCLMRWMLSFEKHIHMIFTLCGSGQTEKLGNPS